MQRIIVKRTNSRDIGITMSPPNSSHHQHLNNVVIFDQKYEPNLTPVPATNPQDMSAFSTVMLSKGVYNSGGKVGVSGENLMRIASSFHV